MGDAVTPSEVAREFGKVEVLEICQEMEISIDSNWHVYDLVKAIFSDIESNGVPVQEDVSDLLWEFLVFCSYYDDDGRVIDPPHDAPDPIAEVSKLVEKPPQCLGWGEPEYNPNCRICKLKDLCVAQREKQFATVSCFGHLYNPDNPQCQECTVFRTCKDRTEGKSET